jgi:methyl-accepting chemotaxis protein
MPKPRLHSIRAQLFLAMAALALLGIIPSLIELRSAYRSWRTAEAARGMDQAGNRLVEGLDYLLLERAATTTALALPEPASETARRELAAIRAGFDSRLAESLAAINASGFERRGALAGDLQRAKSELDGLRRRADAAMAQPTASREAALLSGGFSREISRFVEAQQGSWSDLLREASKSSPEIGRLNVLKQLSWIAREGGGRERSTVAAALVTNHPLTGQDRVTVLTARAVVDGLWRIVEADPAVQEIPELAAAVRMARQEYFESFRSLAALQAEPGSGRIAAAEFIQRTTPQLQTLLGIRDAAIRVTEARAETQASEARLMAFVAAANLLLICITLIGVTALLTRRILRPLAKLSETTGSLTRGEYDQSIEGTGRRDEIGDLARGLDGLRQEALRGRRLEQETQESQGRVAEERRRSREASAAELESSVGGIARQLTERAAELREAARSLEDGAGQTAGQAEAVAVGATEATANVQTVAAAAEELAASVAEITRQVAQAAQITGRALEETRGTDSTMSKLGEAAERIGEVVRLISGIAGQTNLLALNATIEAARAGEAGKGFAVVASEVKSLASQTAKATEEIAGQIGAIQDAAKDAVRSIQGIGAVVTEINEVAGAIAAAVEEQGAATREIARNVAEAASGTNDVSARIARVGQGVAEARDAIAMLVAATDAVAVQGDVLETRLADALKGMRTVVVRTTSP